MNEKVVEFDSVSRRFGRQLVLDDVSFDIEQGLVYGLVGSNGAGKTTIMKHILGLLRAKQGRVRVFGSDPVKQPVQVLRRIGYLSEQRDMPEWMRIEEMMWYTASHYPNWDQEYCQELLATFALDTGKRIKDLSKGMRAQAALVAAVSHRPDLLLLDEPSTGLDAVVRQDILNAIIRAVADDGRTAIFSSHLLDEVERMSDQVLMVDAGKIVLRGTVEELRSTHCWLQVRLSRDHGDSIDLPNFPRLLSAEGLGRNWTLVMEGDQRKILEFLSAQEIEIVSSRTATLEEIFIARSHTSNGRTPTESPGDAICLA